MLETAMRAAREAGRVLLEGSRNEIKVDRIARRDVKLEMDRKAEAAILGIIREKFPDHAILSEEAGLLGPQSEYRWIIDPLDGTVNFSRRIPFWATSIALCRGNDEIVGVIYDPIHDELYSAEKGKGAFMNGRPIHVSERPMEQAAIAYGFASNEAAITQGLRGAEVVTRTASKIRDVGSAAIHLVYVASGRVEGFFEFGINQWDIAAGAVLIREAGGMVEERARTDGAMDFAASNGVCHKKLLSDIHWG